MPQLIFRFLDGHLEIDLFEWWSVEDYPELRRYHEMCEMRAVQLFYKLHEMACSWTDTHDLVLSQICVFNRNGDRVRIIPPGHHRIQIDKSSLVQDDDDEESYTFTVLFLPLVEVESLTEKEVEHLYEKNKSIVESSNTDSFRRFAAVLWVDRNVDLHNDTVFYRVKSDFSVCKVSYYNKSGIHPCWDPEIPTTKLTQERWSRLSEKTNERTNI